MVSSWLKGKRPSKPTTRKETTTTVADTPKLGRILEIDEGRIRDHLADLVRGSVEDPFNALLDAEADRLCNAARYEPTEAWPDTRAGSYQRQLHTKAGAVTLNMPKLRQRTFTPVDLDLEHGRAIRSAGSHRFGLGVHRGYWHEQFPAGALVVAGCVEVRAPAIKRALARTVQRRLLDCPCPALKPHAHSGGAKVQRTNLLCEGDADPCFSANRHL